MVPKWVVELYRTHPWVFDEALRETLEVKGSVTIHCDHEPRSYEVKKVGPKQQPPPKR
jgi:hypothetical protein